MKETLQPSRYWRSLEQLHQTRAYEENLHREFPPQASEWPDGMSRRHFLKIGGASLALAGLTACTRQPSERIVPYVKQPEEIIPGKPLFFATAMTWNGFATGLLVESHEGHPTKIEGNPEHPASLGATNIFHQATLLDLYDPDRSQAVMHAGNIGSWETFLSALNDALQAQQAKRGAGIRILTEGITSPTLYAQIQAVLKKFPYARWHQWEPLNRDNIYEGSRLAFGEIVETHHHFANASVILSLESDFLFTHPHSLRYARDFINGRRVSLGRTSMNRLYVAESSPTVTGSNADHRLPISSGGIETLSRFIAEEIGAVARSGMNLPSTPWLEAVIRDLRQSQGTSLVIVGAQQPPIVHALAHVMNHFLGNIGTTVTYSTAAHAKPVNQLASLHELTNDLQSDKVDLLVVLGGNPIFTAPKDLVLAAHFSRAKMRVHLSTERNETSVSCHWHIPENHFLESWSDARSYDGTISIVQPLILPLYGGKSAHELLDAMLEIQPRSDYEIVRNYWQTQNRLTDVQWRRVLHDGFIEGTSFPGKEVQLRAIFLENPNHATEKIELTFCPDAAAWDGRFANNAWLQELPRPLNKLTWDNAALVSPAFARTHGLSNGDVIDLESNGSQLQVPVWVTPGQAENSITLSLGYGRTQVGRVGKNIGFNAYELRTSESLWRISDIAWRKTGTRHTFATTQTQHLIDSEERQILREATLAAFIADPKIIQHSSERPTAEETLFKPHAHDYDGYHWGMAIDLNACIGCNACILACQSENNIPVVGKDQVGRQRAMHWLRVDSYFSGSPDNPQINHQPVPCMHCENAPCELVCPVAATVHDHEGLNLQVYNRCIGTRYCSNNCPYKVRRFNFYQFADNHTPSLKPMRNPNVTVRSRGVMEKCTYCVQRISAARIQSKLEERTIRDGEIKTACQQACPTEAIIFGDISDPNSRVSRLKASPLNYSMLGQLNTRPRTTYLAKIRNPEASA